MATHESRPFRLWTKAIQTLRQEGFHWFLIRALAKLASPLLELGSLTFFARHLGEPLPEVGRPLQFYLRPCSVADLDRVLAASDPSRSREELQQRLQRGDFCFIAINEDGKIANSLWVTAGRACIPELGVDLVLRSKEAYMYDAYTPPDFRKRGAVAAVMWFALQHLRSAGFQKAYSYVRGDNPPGFRTVRPWQEPIAKLWYLRLRGFRPWILGRPQPGTLAVRLAESKQDRERQEPSGKPPSDRRRPLQKAS